ncbi:hypothetical protein ACI3ET_13395 [Ornithinimicrobium sp. LYQ121]|uniref:hypothetical protein n=1 Tax=Ornithinimicrobium sp. LYQ121 TaxID=3378801 RepID=UPI003853DD6F
MPTTTLLEAGMNGDVHAWVEGLALLDGTTLSHEERQRLRTVGGPPPLALEQVLWRLSSPSRPPGHLARLRRLGDDYVRGVDGDEGALRWLEAALGHRSGSLSRCDLLGPEGLPLGLPAFDEGVEEGRLDEDWLDEVDVASLAEVCRFPAEPEPVWAQLRAAGTAPVHG